MSIFTFLPTYLPFTSPHAATVLGSAVRAVHSAYTRRHSSNGVRSRHLKRAACTARVSLCRMCGVEAAPRLSWCRHWRSAQWQRWIGTKVRRMAFLSPSLLFLQPPCLVHLCVFSRFSARASLTFFLLGVVVHTESLSEKLSLSFYRYVGTYT